jgi:ribosome-associated heat shock protein Hsp15
MSSDAAPCQAGAIETVRIDQWLHAVRLTKTRSAAAEACRGGHVTINGRSAKPASQVAVGDRVEARLHGRQRIVDVAQVVKRRVGAANAAECFDDHSPPPPERDRFEAAFAVRDRGAGRPTKRDRRRIDRLRGRFDR